MRIAFAGTPEFAHVALNHLHRAGFTVALVLTQPDRPAGRGMKLQASPVKQFAAAHHLPLAQPRSLRLDGKYPEDAQAARAALQAANIDVLVVAAYGLILPQWVLDLPPKGCLNIHASLLPRWRGAAPIHRAIEAGDAQTGVTIMQMDSGLDTGDMLLAEALPITRQDTTGSLHDRLALLGGRLIVEALELAACGGFAPQVQPTEGVTYAHKIDKAQARIDWAQPADVVGQKIRAFDPTPGAWTELDGEIIKLWRYDFRSCSGNIHEPCGTVLQVNAEGIVVACGQSSPAGGSTGALRLTALQRAGGKRLEAADFLRGCPIQVGQVLGAGSVAP